MTDHEQRSPEWFQARCGKLTASRFADAISLTQKGQPTQARQSYLAEKVAERLTGLPASHFESAAMRWGTEHESAAVALYVDRRIQNVRQCGFLSHPACDYAGASPDGLLDHCETIDGTDLFIVSDHKSGILEVKCPYNPAVHLTTWLNGMPAEHMAQVQGGMWVTGRGWCDFVSYDPRFPEGMDLYIERVYRDPDYIRMLETELARAWLDVLEMEDTVIQKALFQHRDLGMGREPISLLQRQLERSIAAVSE